MLFHDLPRRKNVRLRDRDYSRPAIYFVTICSAGRHEIFGRVDQNEVRLSDLGLIVEQEWVRIAEAFPSIELDEHVVMPNHIHGLVVIRPAPEKPVALATVVRHFKGKAVARIKRDLNDPEAAPWQRNYYEHGVGNADDLDRVRRYIRDNPIRWLDDDYGPRFRDRTVY